MKHTVTRRTFIQKSMLATAGLTVASPFPVEAMTKKADIRLGLVTYLWGKDWDLPTLIANCETTGYHGVELRVGHAHGVEASLPASQRLEVRKRFEDSPVTCVGYGSNYDFHHVAKGALRKNIEDAKSYIQLCSDIGATGLKVKPNTLPEGVPAEQTIAQIAASLDEIGRYAADLGQLIRVEVHGKKTQQIPVMKAIFEEVTEENVKICWNCNEQDLLEPGLKKNFNSVKKWFGDTVHIRELNEGDYPYQELMDLFLKMKYDGWILLEARTSPEDRIAAMREQKKIFESMTGA